MNAEQLRELAAYFDRRKSVDDTIDCDRAAAYLREQADSKGAVAWAHPDGRVVPASTMDGARKDGGAMLSSLRDYTIPLYAHPAPQSVPEGFVIVPLEPTPAVVARIPGQTEEAAANLYRRLVAFAALERCSVIVDAWSCRADAGGNGRCQQWCKSPHDCVASYRIVHDPALAASPAAPTAPAPAEHPDDVAVDRFAAAMKAKLAQKRAEGRGGWDDPAQCSTEFLARLLRDHIAKGDPVDVGNFAMMLFHRGGRTNEAPAPAPEKLTHSPIYPDEDRDEQVRRARYVEGWNACVDAYKRAALAAADQRQPMMGADLDVLVDRFLAWPLPKSFAPDCGISFDGRKDDEWNKNKTWPIGTNLLTAIEARQMLAHVLGIAAADQKERQC